MTVVGESQRGSGLPTLLLCVVVIPEKPPFHPSDNEIVFHCSWNQKYTRWLSLRGKSQEKCKDVRQKALPEHFCAP